MSTLTESPDYELTYEGHVWVATDIETGIASQGSDPNEAIEMVEEAVRVAHSPHDPASEAQRNTIRRRLGIEREEVEDEIDSPSGMP